MKFFQNISLFLILDSIILLLPIAFIAGSAAVNIFSFLFCLLFFLISIKFNDWKWIKDRFVWVFIIFWIYIFFLGFFSTNQFHSLKTSFFFIRFLFVCLAIGYFGFQKINIKTVIKFWFIIILIFCLDILLQYYSGKNIFGYEMGITIRFSGMMGPTELIAGAYIYYLSAPILGYIIYLIFFKQNLNNFLKLSMILFLFLVVFSSLITGERMNFILLILLYLFSFFTILYIKKKIKIFLILISIFMSIFFISFKYSEATKFRYKELYDIVLNFNDSSWGKLFNSAYRLWLKKPITGYGIKNFRVDCDLELVDINPKTTHQLCSTHPHNLYLELLSETGIIGLLFFFMIFYFYFKKLFFNINFKIINLNKILIINCAISIILILWPIKTAGSFYTTWNGIFLWILMGIALNRKNFNLTNQNTSMIV